MKKIIIFIFLIFNILTITHALSLENGAELDKLFKELKKSKVLSTSQDIEKKIWKIWEIHPSNDRKGFRLTELLDQGSFLINRGELNKAYQIFTQIIAADPNWSEAWNKRALSLYLMGRYQSSLDDINITLTLESRHFGALSGQALNYIELKQYDKAIESYKAAQKIYPVIDSAKKMIPQIQELINDLSV